MKKSIALVLFIGIMTSCHNEAESDSIEKGEYVTRMSADKTEISLPVSQPLPVYSWD